MFWWKGRRYGEEGGGRGDEVLSDLKLPEQPSAGSGGGFRFTCPSPSP